MEVTSVVKSVVPQSNLFEVLESGMEHEQVVYCYDKETGLKAIIAIHNTVLGPSLGGTRMWMYENESLALNDVLRLSRGMTYKASISGLNLGGGKAVIIGDAKRDKTDAMMRKFGEFVNSLNGRYITAEDVGTSTADMVSVSQKTKHVTGLPELQGGGGDPSPVTAYGVYMGMKASAKDMWGSDSLSGKRILVQGCGHVGQNLVKYVTEEGAKVFVSDIHEDHLKKMVADYKAEVVDKDAVYDLEMDIYAPCALGATLNDITIPKLKCAVVAGAANNQLHDEGKHGMMLLEKGIVYAPDFLINAGGLINVYSELQGYNREKALEATRHIYNVTSEILKKAKTEKISTVNAAKQIAEQRIRDKKNQ